MAPPLEDAPPPPPERWVIVEDTPSGPLRLDSILSLEGEMHVDWLLTQDMPARAFAAQFLQYLLAKPALSLEEVAQWDESLLLRVARTWVKDGLWCPKQPSEQITSLEAFREAIQAHQDEFVERFFPGYKNVLDAIAPALKMMEWVNQVRVAMPPPEVLRSLQTVWDAQQAQVIASWLNAVIPLSTLQQMIDAWASAASSQTLSGVVDSSFVRLAHDISTLMAGFLPPTFPPAAFPNLVIGFFQAETEDDQRAFLLNEGFTPEQAEVMVSLRKRYHSSGYQP